MPASLLEVQMELHIVALLPFGKAPARHSECLASREIPSLDASKLNSLVWYLDIKALGQLVPCPHVTSHGCTSTHTNFPSTTVFGLPSETLGLKFCRLTISIKLSGPSLRVTLLQIKASVYARVGLLCTDTDLKFLNCQLNGFTCVLVSNIT